MEKHQLKLKIGRLSMLAAMMSIIMPSVYAIHDEYQKYLCEDNGGNWVDGACDFETDDEDKADKFTDDLQKLEEFEEEKVTLDALCDDLEDSEKYDLHQPATSTSASAYVSSEDKIKVVSSDDVDEDNEPNTKEEDEEFAKELCESETYNGEWKDGECTNFPGGVSSASIGFGDECESRDFQEKHPYFCGEKE
jgi:hypothetical protein